MVKQNSRLSFLLYQLQSLELSVYVETANLVKLMLKLLTVIMQSK